MRSSLHRPTTARPRLIRTEARRAVTVDDLPTSGIISAHRGSVRDGRPHALEGSLSAYRLAVALNTPGAVILDFDVRRSRDGVLLVGAHDTDTSVLSDVTATFSATSLAHLPQHYQPALVGSGWGKEDFASVEQVFAEFGGRACMTFELKAGATDVADFAALVKKWGLERSVFVNTASAVDAAAITGAGLLLHYFGARSTALLDTADGLGAWLVEVPLDASTALVDYAFGKNFKRILAGPTTTAGAASSIDTFTTVAAFDARLHGYVSNAVGYLGRTGGASVRSSDSIAGMVRAGRRAPGLLIVNSGSATDWLQAGLMYLRKTTYGMVYTFGNVSGSCYPAGISAGQPTAKQTITCKLVVDTLPTTTSQQVIFKLYSTVEAPTNASSDTIVGYKLIMDALGVVACNSIPVGGGGASAVFGNLPAVAPVLGVEQTITVDIDDSSAGTQKIRVTRQDPVATLSGAVGAGTVTSLPVNALAVALPTSTKLLLPDGTQVNVSGTAAAGATSVSISSQAVPAMASGSGLRGTSGYVTEGTRAIWRGNYHSAYSTFSDGVCRITDLAVA